MDLWFKRDEGCLSLAVAQIEAPQGLSLAQFSQLVSKDPRIPSLEHTTGGSRVVDTMREYYKQMPLWHPLRGYTHTGGSALIPAMVFPDGRFMEDVYMYGFQGESNDIYIAGVYDLNPTEVKDIRLVTAGLHASKISLETSIEDFLTATGLSPRAFYESETRELEELWPKIRNAYQSHPIFENGFFILIPFLQLSKRQGHVMAGIIEMKPQVSEEPSPN